MTRFWPAGLPIAVVADALAAPTAVRWQGARHTVTRIVRRWRIDQQWWRTQICREYFLLWTESGLLLLVFRDVLRDEWYLQRLYD